VCDSLLFTVGMGPLSRLLSLFRMRVSYLFSALQVTQSRLPRHLESQCGTPRQLSAHMTHCADRLYSPRSAPHRVRSVWPPADNRLVQCPTCTRNVQARELERHRSSCRLQARIVTTRAHPTDRPCSSPRPIPFMFVVCMLL
jgi:hypothetical protein